jgi:hypothetical protein
MDAQHVKSMETSPTRAVQNADFFHRPDEIPRVGRTLLVQTARSTLLSSLNRSHLHVVAANHTSRATPIESTLALGHHLVCENHDVNTRYCTWRSLQALQKFAKVDPKRTNPYGSDVRAFPNRRIFTRASQKKRSASPCNEMNEHEHPFAEQHGLFRIEPNACDDCARDPVCASPDMCVRSGVIRISD